MVSVVLVRVYSDGVPHISAKELSRAEVCGSSDAPKCDFLISSIEFVPAGLRVNLRSYSARIKNMMVLPLSDFAKENASIARWQRERI